jgi:hypothetical protein
LTFSILNIKLTLSITKNVNTKFIKLYSIFLYILAHPTKTTQEYSYILSLDNITQVSESVDKSNHVLQESHNTRCINVLQVTMSLDGKMFLIACYI